MAIHWFPGHMAAATREIKEAMSGVDVVLEVLDARVPRSSCNPMVDDLRGSKPHIKVMAKADLADPAVTAHWVRVFEATPGVRAIPHESAHPERARKLVDLARTLLPADRNKARPMQLLVLGVPNVGKSTLINTLAKRTIAKTGNVPAVTKHQQVVPIPGNVVLVDTPGFLWHKLDPPDVGYRLAVSGSIVDRVIDYTDVAMWAIRYFRTTYPELLKARYKLAALPEDDAGTLEAIARKRACVASGGDVDWHKVSELVVREFRQGTLGRITLERPSDWARPEPVVEAPP
jgi:ribosome biogenesis GTPase A